MAALSHESMIGTEEIVSYCSSIAEIVLLCRTIFR